MEARYARRAATSQWISREPSASTAGFTSRAACTSTSSKRTITASVWCSPRPLSITFGGHRYDVIRLSGEPPPKSAVLLRHPHIKSVDEGRLEQEVLDVQRYRAVAPLFIDGSSRRPACPARADQGRAQVVPGVALPPTQAPNPAPCFCSELVGKFFNAWASRSSTAAPENTANQSAPSRQPTRACVSDAIITAADIPDDAHGEVIGVLQPRSRGLDPRVGKKVRVHANERNLVGRLEHAVTSLKEFLLTLVGVREDKKKRSCISVLSRSERTRSYFFLSIQDHLGYRRKHEES